MLRYCYTCCCYAVGIGAVAATALIYNHTAVTFILVAVIAAVAVTSIISYDDAATVVGLLLLLY